MPLNARIVMPVAVAALLTGCGLNADDGGGQTTATRGVLGALRPGADPAVVKQLTLEERMRAQAQQQQNNGQANNQDSFLNGLSRVLPRVSTDPIAPPAEQVAAGSTTSSAEEGAAIVESANAAGSQPSPSVATYGASYYGGSVPPPPPGALGIGMVPPPSALPVSLSTQVQTYSGNMADANYNPYINQYLNPYGIPVQQQAAAPQERPAGLFGNGRSSSAATDDGASSGNRQVVFNPITPSGMESRSQFKQRDDLRVLWKGAISQSSYLGALANDPKAVSQLNRVQVGLPSESTRGNFSVGSRQIDAIFKSGGMDKHIAPAVRKAQTELVQSYYRYIYTYNKFCFAQQTAAARKQEVELANSPAEQQRATADLSQAQNEVEGAKDDMRSAQVELAQASSPSAARAVIGKVSGVSPSLDSLIAAEARSNKSSSGKVAMFGSMFNPLGSFFKMGHSKPEPKKEANGESNSEYAAPENATASADLDKSSEQEQPGKGKSKKKGKLADPAPIKSKLKVVEADTMPDLTPAPKEEPKATVEAPGRQSSTSHLLDCASVSFMLKGVNVSPRKSVLTVAIKNAGNDAFNFSPDLISVAEGSRRLSEATTRADFDTTMVQPNEEVKGTITIFGRPWSDKLTVCLSEGGKAIQMRRQ